jgi:hypothetical protein
MNSEEGKSSIRPASKTRRRRRRSANRLLLGDPHEYTTEYPGFFVLPRPDRLDDSTQTPFKRRLNAFKLAAVLLLLSGGFVAVFAYLFYSVTPAWTAPEPQPPLFVHGPKLLHTNSDEQGLRR